MRIDRQYLGKPAAPPIIRTVEKPIPDPEVKAAVERLHQHILGKTDKALLAAIADVMQAIEKKPEIEFSDKAILSRLEKLEALVNRPKPKYVFDVKRDSDGRISRIVASPGV